MPVAQAHPGSRASLSSPTKGAMATLPGPQEMARPRLQPGPATPASLQARFLYPVVLLWVLTAWPSPAPLPPLPHSRAERMDMRRFRAQECPRPPLPRSSPLSRSPVQRSKPPPAAQGRERCPCPREVYPAGAPNVRAHDNGPEPAPSKEPTRGGPAHGQQAKGRTGPQRRLGLSRPRRARIWKSRALRRARAAPRPRARARAGALGAVHGRGAQREQLLPAGGDGVQRAQ